jgi:hypothetical protein
MTTDTLRRWSRSFGIALLLLCAVFMATASGADGVSILGQYSGTKSDTLKLALYSEGDQTVGLVNMVTPTNQRISVTFKKSELTQFTALVQKAAAIQSEQWQLAGSYTETETNSPSHIVVYGGPGLQLSLTDPSIGAWSLTVKPEDVAGVLEVLKEMGEKVTE